MDASEAGSTFTRMLHAIDTRDWRGVRDAFADRIHLDYSSLFGVPAAAVDGDPHVEGWRVFAGAFDATQHITGPIISEVRGETATARTHVRAYHRMAGQPGGDLWMVAGHYQIGLQRIGGVWKIDALTLIVFYQEGNLDIHELARKRTAS